MSGLETVEHEVLDAEDFLELVWGKREAWVDLPAKVGGNWVPFHALWPCEGLVSRRIDSCLRDGEDLYFSVAQFSERGRRIEDVLSTHWLWADLDEVHPEQGAKDGLMPTLAWESSPGRYQALWRLTKSLRPETLDKLNQALSYHLGADTGGWDLTQVLRVVGTRNFKYSEAPMVRLLWHKSDLRYDPRRVWKRVRQSYRPVGVVAGSEGAGAKSARGRLPARARALLKVPADSVVEGERSSRLWEIECLLGEAGWGEDAIYEVVSESAWNKWARVRTGEERLRREIRKAIRHVRRKAALRESGAEKAELPPVDDGDEADDDTEEKQGEPVGLSLPFVRYASFMAMSLDAPRWVVEDMWTQGAHGLIGGEPKTSKSTIALALALSVASGRPFLGHYPVHVTGPVLMIQEENAPWVMQDRMRKIANSYGLIGEAEVIRAPRGSIAKKSVDVEFPTDMPFRLLNNYGFDLSDEDHRNMLLAEVEQIRPAMVILDPLYLMFGGADYDKAHDLMPFLKWLMQLRYEYECATILIHHFRKQSQGGPVVRSGQRVLGSTVFHGWSESAVYCERMDVGEEMAGRVKVRVDREFRNIGPRRPIEIELAMGDPGDLKFEAEVRGFDITGLIVRHVTDDPGLTVRQLADRLGVNRRQALRWVRGADRLVLKKAGKAKTSPQRVYLA